MEIGHDTLTTFAGAMVFGVLFTLIAQKLNMSTIIVLVVGGIVVGPECLNWITPESLGGGLKTIISLAVGLILFEGGLNLDIKGYKTVSREIRGVLTRGVLITWLTTTLAIKLLFSLPWDFSLLAASLIIVTGPTVIGPLLKRLRVKRNIRTILHWEGVLIDPIGVFIALLCYEFIIDPSDQPFRQFLVRAIVGIAFGTIGGLLTALVIRRRWIPEESLNISFLASALAIFTLSDLVSHESGLLSVTIAGFVIGYLHKQQIEQVKIYKAELIQLLIGLLFILLSANLDLKAFHSFLTDDMRGVALIVFVMIVVRPLNIFASTIGCQLDISDKLFLSWVAPRGIVAASMASLFALNLHELGFENAIFLETFTYSIIIGTVLFQGLTAKWVGGVLKVLEPKPKGWLVIGAHQLGRTVAAFIKSSGVPVIIFDTNIKNILDARRQDLTAINGDALTVSIENHPDLYEIGNVLAITANEDLNTLICQRWRREISEVNLYRWGSKRSNTETEGDSLMIGRQIWENLNLSEITSLTLEDRQVGRIHTRLNVDDIANKDLILMCVFNQEVLPFLPQNAAGEGSILTCQPTITKLDTDVAPKKIIISHAKDLPAVTRELLESVRDDFPSLDINELYEKLIEYEHKYSSLICPDASLPHAYTAGLTNSILLVAKLTTSIKSFHSEDPVSLVFLVLSPEGQPRQHLQMLSEISRLLIDDNNRKQLLSASTVGELYDAFAQGTVKNE